MNKFGWTSRGTARTTEAKFGLSYLAVTTPAAIFDGPTPSSFLDITDGTSNTIAVIEVPPRASSWMEPVDFDQQQLDHVLANGLSETHPGGTQVSLMDGSVRWVQSTIPDQTFNALLTRNGGEEIRDGEW